MSSESYRSVNYLLSGEYFLNILLLGNLCPVAKRVFPDLACMRILNRSSLG